jgi:hypothetical protein
MFFFKMRFLQDTDSGFLSESYKRISFNALSSARFLVALVQRKPNLLSIFLHIYFTVSLAASGIRYQLVSTTTRI